MKGKKKIDKMISEGLKSLADIVVTEGKLVREKIRESRYRVEICNPLFVEKTTKRRSPDLSSFLPQIGTMQFNSYVPIPHTE